MYCVSCGSIIGDAFRFCEFCGMPNADYFAKEDIVVEENAPENAEPSAVIPPAPQPEPEADTQQTLICEKCGRELDADSLFCDKCGAPVGQKQQEPVGYRCKKCGAELEEGFVFCDRCGARQ